MTCLRIVSSVLLVATACTGDDATTTDVVPPASERLRVNWTLDRLTPTGSFDGGSIEIGKSDGALSIWLSVPPGTTWRVDGRTGTTQKPLETVRVEIAVERLGALAFDQLQAFDPELTLELALPDRRDVVTRLPIVDVRILGFDYLARVEKGPVLFGVERRDAGAEHTAVFPAKWHIMGPHVKLALIDYVVVAELLPDAHGTKACVGDDGTPITMTLKHTEGRIYDRRTGEIVARETVGPEMRCLGFAERSADGDFVADSVRNDAAVAGWATLQLRHLGN